MTFPGEQLGAFLLILSRPFSSLLILSHPFSSLLILSLPFSSLLVHSLPFSSLLFPGQTSSVQGAGEFCCYIVGQEPESWGDEVAAHPENVSLPSLPSLGTYLEGHPGW